jgi:integrase/recombinase XerD
VKRGAATSTRNLRLIAIGSFFRFVSFEEQPHSAMIPRMLAVPSKRHDKRLAHFPAEPRSRQSSLRPIR